MFASVVWAWPFNLKMESKESLSKLYILQDSPMKKFADIHEAGTTHHACLFARFRECCTDTVQVTGQRNGQNCLRRQLCRAMQRLPHS